MSESRFDRNERFFGKEGQELIRRVRVAVVGVGGLGTHLLQQLALLGVRDFSLIDADLLKESNRNRYVGSRHDDVALRTRKIDIGERIIRAVEPEAKVDPIFDSLVSDRAFAAIASIDWIFGCLDSEGARLVLNELALAYDRRYVDLASDIPTAEIYGGRVCFVSSSDGCLVCRALLDVAEAQEELENPDARRARKEIYGIANAALDEAGPSVVSINGVVASLAITEFMLELVGKRRANPVVNYYANTGKVTVSKDLPRSDCFYCKTIRAQGADADTARYIRAGVGAWLR